MGMVELSICPWRMKLKKDTLKKTIILQRKEVSKAIIPMLISSQEKSITKNTKSSIKKTKKSKKHRIQIILMKKVKNKIKKKKLKMKHKWLRR